MNWRHVGLGIAVLAGLLFVAMATVIGLAGTPQPAGSGPGAAGGLVLFVCALVILWKLWRTPSGPDVSPSPWADDDAFTRAHLETTPAEETVSGTELAENVAAAAEEARGGVPVAESVGPVRDPLRATLTEALVHSGQDREAVQQQLAAGTWTDDPVAAAVLDESVTPPDRPFRARLRAWLFPEKAVRKRSARAMAAVSAAADEALPTVVGQQAPRPVPVVAPDVADLQRAADGSLQRAVDGSLPPLESVRDDGSEADAQPENKDSAGETAPDSNSAEPGESPASPATRATEKDAPGRARKPEEPPGWDDLPEVRD